MLHNHSNDDQRRCRLSTAASLACALAASLVSWHAQGAEPPSREPAQAADEAATARAASSQDGNSSEPIDVEAVAQREPATETISREQLQAPRFASTGEAAAQLPGVWVLRRGAGAAEPVVRGLGWERVVTQVGHLPLFGACPGHMDPPLTYLRPHSIEGLSVIKGLPSVTLGASSTGGRAVARPDYEREDRRRTQLDAWAGWGFDSARRGMVTDGGLRGGTGPLDFGLGAEVTSMRDYQAPSGVWVPAVHRELGVSESLGYHLGSRHRLWHALSYVRHQAMSYPALPMDLDRTDFWLTHLGYRYRGSGPVAEVSVELALMDVDHAMSNRAKSNRPRLHASTDARSQAFGGRSAADWTLGAAGELSTGVDLYALSRDALRERILQASGRRFEEAIWPDARQAQRGAFAEWRSPNWQGVELRIGGRADHWQGSVAAADRPGHAGRPIRHWYAHYYGPEANDLAQQDLLGAANLVAVWSPIRALSFELGGGWASRPPAVTERYFSFAPAPGGFLVGNPTLEPEHKLAGDAGFGWTHEWIDLRLCGYAAWLRDYILPTALARVDVNADGAADWVRGYRNVAARMGGAELQATGHLGSRVTIPTSVAFVLGHNIDDDTPLPEIPPWEIEVAARVGQLTPVPFWLQLGGRFVGEQQRVDPDFPENPTDAFALLHLRAGLQLFGQLDLALQLENLLDSEYHEHLTRETLLPTEGLAAGSEVPAPGRTAFVSARWSAGWIR